MKNVYYFGDGKAEGAADQKNTLGGKGANLAEMTNLGIPVPPGFTLTTNLCMAYLEHGVYPESLENEVQSAVEKIEMIMGQKFGDPDNPPEVPVMSPVTLPTNPPAEVVTPETYMIQGINST